MIFDLAIAYVWEYDEEFVSMIETKLQQTGLTTFRVTENNVFEITDLVKQKKLNFRCYLDRASDQDDDFSELAKILARRKTKIFNPYKKIEHAIDKANMHLEFISAGINVPYSIIIPPHSLTKDLLISVDDLSILGNPFIIKPCNTTGGGIGVVKGAESLKEVLQARQKHDEDKYLIQQKILPVILENKKAWFRCFWAFGKTICAWWDDETHIYENLSEDEIEIFQLKKLFQITRTIRKITELDFFSTEIALTPSGKFIVIDYVNDQCDMRLKSLHYDGVPDNIVEEIISNLQKAVKKEIKTNWQE